MLSNGMTTKNNESIGVPANFFSADEPPLLEKYFDSAHAENCSNLKNSMLSTN